MLERAWNALARGDGAALGGAVVMLGIALSLLLRATVGSAHRSRLRAPALMLLSAASGWIALTLWQPTGASRSVFRLVPLLLMMLAFGRLATVILFDWVLSRRLRHDAPRIVRDIAEGVITLVALLITLRLAGVEAVPLVTTSAVITAIVGLSLQDTLGNLFAGLALQAQRPFDLGEWIQIDREGMQLGQVIEMNWRATKLLTADNQELNVPNSQLARTPILNLSRPGGHCRRTLEVLVPHDVPTLQALPVLQRALIGAFGVLEQPKPAVLTYGFADQGIRYRLIFHIAEFGQRDAIDAGLRDRIWYAMRRAGIPIARGAGIAFNAWQGQAALDGGDLETRVKAIRRIDFLRDLPDSAVQTLAADARTELFAPGELVVRQGDPGVELYLCEKGELVVLLTLEGGELREIARIQAGGMFGEFAQVTGELRTATVKAVTACELVVIGTNAFAAVLGSDPQFAEMISQRLAERKAALEVVAEASPAARTSVDEHKNNFLQRLREFLAI
jgi:small-conductance mechanosensitive channel/CRP-like cAMP-binding protein